MDFAHLPVLLDETLKLLNVKPGGVYLDCTLGGGGHSEAILSRLGDGTLFAVDKDIEAIAASKKRFEGKTNVVYIHDDFKNALSNIDEEVLLDGILIDLGVSSYQIDNPSRGFSYTKDAPLDMRMDTRSGISAADIVNNYSYEDLKKIFKTYGEEEFAASIARNIVKKREEKKIETTSCFVEIIESSMPKKVVYKRKGAPKKVFQALRIEVNGELALLGETLSALAKRLKKGGRIVVISFHSLEDRIVKNTFRALAEDCICPKNLPVCMCDHRAEIKILTKRPVVPSEAEVAQNSRSACSKLRAAERI